MHLVAKFRHLESTVAQDGSRRAKLRPVNAKSSYAPEGSEENMEFWTATPTGEAAVIGEPPVPHGAACFIDIVLVEHGETVDDATAWRITHATLHEGGQLDVEFRAVGNWHDFVSMGIQRADTVRRLLPIVVAGFEGRLNGTSPQRWRVTFRPAAG